MLPAETAILIHLKTIGIVLLVFERIVVALLALCTGKSDLCTHKTAPPVFLASLNRIKKLNIKKEPGQVK